MSESTVKKDIDPQERFGFGKNWGEFVARHLSEERIDAAQQRLLHLLGLRSLKGYHLLDIGCGSGLHSLAAFRAGAASVASFDYDPNSVATAKKLYEREGRPENWTIQQGSVLDKDFMRSLKKADIVYSWGVLHHTGHMWKAIENARIPLAENGTFAIALYSYTAYEGSSISGRPTPEKWLEIKQQYNAASEWEKRLWEYRECWNTLNHSNPYRLIRSVATRLKEILTYKKKRGMDYWTDMRDWLGGWPMEFVKESECVEFCKTELGLELVRLITGEGNTEFVFRPLGSSNYWDAILAKRREQLLPPPFSHVEGHMWSIPLPDKTGMADTLKKRESPLSMSEDGSPLWYGHADYEAITQLGMGRYLHWHDVLQFSASDNSDPNTNGRTYSIQWDEPCYEKP